MTRRLSRSKERSWVSVGVMAGTSISIADEDREECEEDGEGGVEWLLSNGLASGRL